MMPNKPKFPLARALAVANEIKSLLAPFCERIEIAGSLRRGKPEVGDVELLFIPRVESRQEDFFSSAPVDLAAEMIENMLASQLLAKRPAKTGVFTWGDLNKLAVHLPSGIPVDLFSEPNAEDWARSLVIRTGPRESNINLITTAAKLGIGVHAYGVGLTDRNGNRIPCESELEFFKICGVTYREPNER
ncbi:MAG: hypothetical protein KGL39_43655 [Patescibacteria group bacterium]|nr:hypothetical protein [Patescibacteria group bacterium]